MKNPTRRDFLRQLSFLFTSAAVAHINPVFGQSIAIEGASARPFEMLVLGDSLAWGQGLHEEQKFYYKVKEWIAKTQFQRSRCINTYVLAHSGAVIDGNADPGIIPHVEYDGELNISTPTIKQQVDRAVKKYTELRRLSTDDIDLIILSGGINDVNLRNIFNPFYSEQELVKEAETHCYGKMRDLLLYTAQNFKNARFVVPGYYRLVSNVMTEDMLRRFIKGVIRSKLRLKVPIPKNLIGFEKFKRFYVRRSQVWYDLSNQNLKKAVEEINNDSRLSIPTGNRLVFVPVEFQDENCYGGKNSFIWELNEQSVAIDPYVQLRNAICKLQKGKVNHEICFRASTGHPNVAGADAFAKAITEKLPELFPTFTAQPYL
jgi:lysophospholipase L1-like esterase